MDKLLAYLEMLPQVQQPASNPYTTQQVLQPIQQAWGQVPQVPSLNGVIPALQQAMHPPVQQQFASNPYTTQQVLQPIQQAWGQIPQVPSLNGVIPALQQAMHPPAQQQSASNPYTTQQVLQPIQQAWGQVPQVPSLNGVIPALQQAMHPPAQQQSASNPYTTQQVLQPIQQAWGQVPQVPSLNGVIPALQQAMHPPAQQQSASKPYTPLRMWSPADTTPSKQFQGPGVASSNTPPWTGQQPATVGTAAQQHAIQQGGGQDIVSQTMQKYLGSAKQLWNSLPTAANSNGQETSPYTPLRMWSPEDTAPSKQFQGPGVASSNTPPWTGRNIDPEKTIAQDAPAVPIQTSSVVMQKYGPTVTSPDGTATVQPRSTPISTTDAMHQASQFSWDMPGQQAAPALYAQAHGSQWDHPWNEWQAQHMLSALGFTPPAIPGPRALQLMSEPQREAVQNAIPNIAQLNAPTPKPLVVPNTITNLGQAAQAPQLVPQQQTAAATPVQQATPGQMAGLQLHIPMTSPTGVNPMAIPSTIGPATYMGSIQPYRTLQGGGSQGDTMFSTGPHSYANLAALQMGI